MTDDLAAFIAARLDEDEAAADVPGWPEVSYGITEAAFAEWDVREYRRGFLHRIVASGLPKREAEVLRDKHRAALYADHADYRAEWAL